MPERLGGSGEKYATFTSGDRLDEPLDTRVPGDGARDVASRASEGARLLLVRAEPFQRRREAFARRCHDEPRLSLTDDVERPARIRHRHDRLLGEKRLV